MSEKRKDSWTSEEDQLLAHCVIAHVKEGSTQLKAFEEVGCKLSRTAAACGFRWNSHVRKMYADELLQAKKERKIEKLKELPTQKEQTISMDNVIFYLRNIEQELHFLQKENKELVKKIAYLNKQNQELVDLNSKLSSEYREVMLIMEQARKMIVS